MSLPDLIENTLLFRLDGIASHPPDVDVLAQAEWLNLGGSVKDQGGS